MVSPLPEAQADFISLATTYEALANRVERNEAEKHKKRN